MINKNPELFSEDLITNFYFKLKNFLMAVTFKDIFKKPYFYTYSGFLIKNYKINKNISVIFNNFSERMNIGGDGTDFLSNTEEFKNKCINVLVYLENIWKNLTEKKEIE